MTRPPVLCPLCQFSCPKSNGSPCSPVRALTDEHTRRQIGLILYPRPLTQEGKNQKVVMVNCCTLKGEEEHQQVGSFQCQVQFFTFLIWIKSSQVSFAECKTKTNVKPKVGQRKKETATKKIRLSHNQQYRIDFNQPGVQDKLVGWVKTLARQNGVCLHFMVIISMYPSSI